MSFFQISEVIVLIAHMFDKSAPGDQFILLTYEKNISEKLYSVLLAPNERMHKTAKENALRVRVTVLI